MVWYYSAVQWSSALTNRQSRGGLPVSGMFDAKAGKYEAEDYVGQSA